MQNIYIFATLSFKSTTKAPISKSVQKRQLKDAVLDFYNKHFMIYNIHANYQIYWLMITATISIKMPSVYFLVSFKTGYLTSATVFSKASWKLGHNLTLEVLITKYW